MVIDDDPSIHPPISRRFCSPSTQLININKSLTSSVDVEGSLAHSEAASDATGKDRSDSLSQ